MQRPEQQLIATKRSSDEQKPISHWIPPAIVGGNKED